VTTRRRLTTVHSAARREVEVICEGRPMLILHNADREAVAAILADLLLDALQSEGVEAAP
jgi:hypothetical protein